MTSLALTLVSFLSALGYVIDLFREGAIVNAYMALTKVEWSELPVFAVDKADKILSRLFGEQVFSLRALGVTFCLSVCINFLVFGSLVVSNIPALFSSHSSFLQGTIVSGFIHDLLSIIITRYLIRSFLERKKLVKILFDLLVAYFLFRSAHATVVTGQIWAMIAAEQRNIPMDELALASIRDWFGTVFLQIPENPFMLDPPLNMLETACTYVVVISTLLPTWLYVASGILAILGRWIGEMSLPTLESLERGSTRRYTKIFVTLSVALVVCAVFLDSLI